jgi:hypothetical protein
MFQVLEYIVVNLRLFFKGSSGQKLDVHHVGRWQGVQLYHPSSSREQGKDACIASRGIHGRCV